ncbi:MAG TPA: HAMP domain-containing sensor histidine kinase [Rhizomicrobium sp.]|nr:HAMP domain-containing sensor histidine kinase [Rhizomicrobium sp.]
MRAPRLLRTLAFRIVALYLAIFAVSAAAIVGFTYWNTARALNAQTDQIVDVERESLAEHYERFGLGGLTNVIANRSTHGEAALYLLADADKRPIVGNLDSWPDVAQVSGNIVEFDYERRVGNHTENHRARGQQFVLTGGFLLLVARDIAERYQTEKLFTTMLPWSLLLMILLGLFGGILISRNFLTRLDLINRTSREIMAGDLSRRLPLGRGGDEFDTLAINLNRMLERTERLMRGMRDVTDSIAHDLRTPLNRLRNRLEGVLHTIGPDGPGAREIEAAVEETDHLIGTFNALLLIAEAEAGVARESMEQVDLRGIVEGVAELYGPLADEKEITLSIPPSGSAFVACNPRLVSQALANLLDNAIKYTPAGGRVTVALEHTPAGIALHVADSGPGIPNEDHARVLQRFVRLEASRHSPGTGLGLSLVAAVARLHDAKLELSDNRPGLRATLLFPVPTRRQPALPQIAAQKLIARN